MWRSVDDASNESYTRTLTIKTASIRPIIIAAYMMTFKSIAKQMQRLITTNYKRYYVILQSYGYG